MLNPNDFIKVSGKDNVYIYKKDGSMYVCRSGQSISDFLNEIDSEQPDTQIPVTLTYIEFRALFTSGEQEIIMTAAQQNHLILDWLLQAAGAGKIELSNPLTISGVNSLVAAGLIAPGRSVDILAGVVP